MVRCGFCVLTHYSKFPVRPRCQRSMYSPRLPFLFAANSPLSLRLIPLSSRCSDLLSPFPHGTLHEQPGRAVWVASAECVCCPSPSFLPNVLDLQSFKHQAQAVLTLPARHPSQATLVCRLGCFGGAARGFSSRLVALVTHLSSVLDFRKAWLVFFFRRRGFLRIFLDEYQFLFLVFWI
jgi:hypothetical protein